METNVKPQLIKRTFENWYPEDLQDIFGLEFVRNMPSLTQWTSAQWPLPPEYVGILEELQMSLETEKNHWNEQELIVHFIAPFLFTLHFSGKKFNSFMERTLRAEIDGYELSGVVDWMAAKGRRDPIAPYFFLHEYKRFKMGDADPLGQVLAAMLAAQSYNLMGQPIYGCYVVANIWYFVLLEGKNYSFSEGYDVSTAQELAKVWSILHETKLRVEKMAGS